MDFGHRQPGALRGWGNCDRFLTGRSFNVVVMTFITRNFSRGWWTSAVHGPKLSKIFQVAWEKMLINKMGTQGGIYCHEKAQKSAKKDGGGEKRKAGKRKRGILTAK
jgi:hypothetical protein